MASLTQWTWVCISSRSWWWTGRPGVLWFVKSQRVRHDWATELNWTGKTIALTRQTFVIKVMSLLVNMLSRLVIAFLPRSKHLLISWLQSPSAVILEPKEIKSVTVSIVSASICHEVMGPDAMILIFESWVLRQLFHFPFSLSSRCSLVPLHLLPIEWCHLHMWGYWYFSRQSWFQLELHPVQPFT